MKRFLGSIAFLSIVCVAASNAEAGGCPGNCNGNGSCDFGTNTCTCFVGFAGAACDQCAPDYYNYPVCSFCSAAITCSGNGTCGPTGFCNCNSGWIGTNCEIPFCPGGCGNGVCVAPNDCECFPGWTGPNCDTPVAVPTVSEWGLAILTISGLIAGTLMYGRRPITVKVSA